jgi:uncharacterized membrane protein YhaH (DUF805 family)
MPAVWGMANWRLNRLSFWLFVAVYFAIKIPLAQSATANFGAQQNFASVLDTWLVIVLALAVGARFNDAGRNRNLGIGLTFLITVVLPLALLFGYLAVFPEPAGVSKEEFLDLFRTINLVPFALLIALLIWAGTRPGKPAPVSATTP